MPQSALGVAPLAGSTAAVPASVKGFVAGASVEDVSGRAAKTKLFTNPDGSTTLALSERPVFYQDAHGVWQPIDTSIVADPSTPGGLMSKANIWTAHFAPLPAGVVIDSPEGQLAFSPTGTAAVAPTQTAADTVTYVNAWPGVDLRYLVLGDEVKETIVLNRRPTSATFAFSTAGLGFTAAAGGVLAPQRSKSKWTLSAPMIDDKLGTPLPDAPVTLSPTGAAASAGVAVAVSPSWLAAQPASAFPLLVDPSATYGANTMTAYKSDGTTCTACGVEVGNPNQSNGTFYWRSVGYFDYFDSNPMLGEHVSNATITVGSQAGGTANGYTMGVWLPTAYSYAGAVGGGEEASGTIGTGGTVTSSSLTALFDYWVHNKLPNGALGFSGYETPGLYTFKQFNDFTLSLTFYQTAPTAPQAPTASATADGILHASWSPPADDGGGPLTYKINLYHSTGGAPANWLVCSGSGVTWTGLGDDTSWYFGITAQNAVGSSAEVDTNTVTVTHPPGTPTALTGYPGNGAVYVTWSPPADPGGTPVDSYFLDAYDETNPAHPQVTVTSVCCSGYPIVGLTNGDTYAILVLAHDHDGYSPTPAVTPTSGYVTPSANPPPYPVQQLYGASPASGGAFLSWRPPLATNGGAAVTSYAVTAYDTVTGYFPPQHLNIPATATSFYFSGLTNGRSYLFAISALNANGYTNVFTNTVTPSATPPPGPVTNATAQPGDTYVVLQWTAPASPPAPTGYVIYRYNDTNPISPVFLDYQNSTSTTPSYTWNGLASGTKYLFYVFSYNANGFSVPTATNPPVTPTSGDGNLLRPTGVEAISADTRAVVSWIPPTLLPMLTTYTVNAYVASTGAAAGTSPPTAGTGPCTTGSATDPPIVTSPPSTSCLVFAGLTNGTSYYFTVTAALLGINLGALSVALETSTPSPAVTPAGRPFPPSIASVANATTAGGAATVTWTPPPTQPDGVTPGDNGSPIISYTLTATPATGANPQATVRAVTYMVPNPPPTTYTDTIPALLDASPYNITVTATNVIGTSDLSTAVTFTPTGVPFPPAGVTATAGPGTGTATVTWSPPPVQAFGVPGDNGSPITSYTVTPSPSGQPTTVYGSPPPTTAQVSGLSPGRTYTFTVTATNGIASSLPSPSSNPVIVFGPPSAPTTVTAFAGDSFATVSWSASSTNGVAVQNYTVFTYLASNNSQVSSQATPNGGTTSTTVINLTDGQSYYFKVQANSSAGSGPLSTQSNTVTPTAGGGGVAPSVPTNVTAVPQDGEAAVSWSASTSPDAPLSSYTVYASPGGLYQSTTDGSTTTLTFDGLVDGTTYTFTVVANTNSGLGSSAPSDPSGPVTPQSNAGTGSGSTFAGGPVVLGYQGLNPNDTPDPTAVALNGSQQIYATGTFPRPGDNTVKNGFNMVTENWIAGTITIGQPMDALPTLPSWLIPGIEFAPTVDNFDGTYVMWFSGGNTDGTPNCLDSASSTSPDGPFTVNAGRFCDASGLGALDPSIYQAGPNDAWLVYSAEKKDDGRITVVKLTPDGQAVDLSVAATVIATFANVHAALPNLHLGSGTSFDNTPETPVLENPQLVPDTTLGTAPDGNPLTFDLYASFGSYNGNNGTAGDNGQGVDGTYHTVQIACETVTGPCYDSNPVPDDAQMLAGSGGAFMNPGGLFITHDPTGTYALFAAPQNGTGLNSWESRSLLYEPVEPGASVYTSLSGPSTQTPVAGLTYQTPPS